MDTHKHGHKENLSIQELRKKAGKQSKLGLKSRLHCIDIIVYHCLLVRGQNFCVSIVNLEDLILISNAGTFNSLIKLCLQGMTITGF